MNPPKIWTGDDDGSWKDFVKCLVNYLKAKQEPAELWVSVAVSFLGGRAKNHWSVSDKIDNDPTWDEFHSLMSPAFSDIDQDTKARKNLHYNCKQTSGAIDKYSSRFSELVAQLSHTLDKHTLIFLFREGHPQ